MLKKLADYFKTGPDRPVLADAGAIRRIYERKRWSIFISLIVGYGFFYTCRLGLSVTKKPLIDAGVLTASELGIVGSVLLYVYAIGKMPPVPAKVKRTEIATEVAQGQGAPPARIGLSFHGSRAQLRSHQSRPRWPPSCRLGRALMPKGRAVSEISPI